MQREYSIETIGEEPETKNGEAKQIGPGWTEHAQLAKHVSEVLSKL